MDPKTLIIDNFSGRLTRLQFGRMNSGLVRYPSSPAQTAPFGYDPFSVPGALRWFEVAQQIDSGASVITDLIMAGKVRLESGITYVYAIGNTGRLYKIQVNNPGASNPDYDTPVLLTTITSNSPTFTRGASIEFFGTTERIFIGHDVGITRVDFDGTNETFVGSAGSYTQNVPRPLIPFLGKLYFGNGSNIGEIDTTNTVTSYTRLSPGFPSNSQVRDIDNSDDGAYIEFVVTSAPLSNITLATPDTGQISNSDSYIFKWNGTDNGYTSYNTFPAFQLVSNITFGGKQYTFGYDLAGMAIYNPVSKMLSPTFSSAPQVNATASSGNIVAFFVPSFSQGTLKATNFLYGNLDQDYPADAWYPQIQVSATSPQTDVICVPYADIITNVGFGTSYNGYTGGVFGYSKIYFSTLEYNSSSVSKARFYKYYPVSTTFGTPQQGVYTTQIEMFPKKMSVNEIRIYTNDIVASNGFYIGLVDKAGNIITGSDYTFTQGSTMTTGDDRMVYNPRIKPQYACGLYIQNTGTTHMQINKVELDLIDKGR